MNVLYQKILDLEIWHDYYLGQPNPPKLPPTGYDISDMLALVPTAECVEVLRNLRWIFRQQPQGASIFANVESVSSGQFVTSLPVNVFEKLTFLLVVRDRYFGNFTNLPLTTNRDQIYYFSNLSGNHGDALFLTQSLPVYTANTTYHLGQLVTHQGKTYEALQDNTSDSAIPDVEDWESLPLSQYVTELDQLPQQGISRIYTIPRASPHETYRWSLLDVNEQKSFMFEVTVPDAHTPGNAIATNLNLFGQIPGR
ncbi:carbohydrate-binding protein, partial [Aetokthonos hydrillicola]